MKKRNIPRRSKMIDRFDESMFEKIRPGNRFAKRGALARGKNQSAREDGGFKCAACKCWVTACRENSGVNHRNHCPLCLVSLHLDENRAGDRLSPCRSRMAPIGLTFKQTYKRYAQAGAGELMVIHRCAGCGKISINRAAADDDPHALYGLAKASLELPAATLAELASAGIHPLDAAGFNAAYAQIYGKAPIAVELAAANVLTESR